MGMIDHQERSRSTCPSWRLVGSQFFPLSFGRSMEIVDLSARGIFHARENGRIRGLTTVDHRLGPDWAVFCAEALRITPHSIAT